MDEWEEYDGKGDPKHAIWMTVNYLWGTDTKHRVRVEMWAQK